MSRQALEITADKRASVAALVVSAASRDLSLFGIPPSSFETALTQCGRLGLKIYLMQTVKSKSLSSVSFLSESRIIQTSGAVHGDRRNHFGGGDRCAGGF